MPYIVEKRQVTKWVPGRYETYVAVPAHYDYSTSPGWNAGAHSLVWLQQPPPGYEGITARYTFKARKESLGIFVGLGQQRLRHFAQRCAGWGVPVYGAVAAGA